MRLAFAVSILLMVPAIAEAQSTALAAGARIRVTSPSDDLKRHVATVTEVRGDTIVVMAGRSGMRTVALNDVTALEVSAGRRSRFLRDAGLGLSIGIVAGAVIGAATYEECEPDGFFSCFMQPDSRGQSATMSALAGGVLGLIGGAIVGAFDRTDRWERRELPVKTALRPSPSGGIAFSISRAF